MKLRVLISTLFALAISILLTGCFGTKEPVVVFETNQGKFVVQLHPDYAPKTVDLFLKHVDAGFYDGVIFHRVIPEFMAQSGGFSENFERKEPLGTVVNESVGGLPNSKGTIAMARTSNPDSASSQFYINVVDNPNLNSRDGRPGYTVFGTVVEGIEVPVAITEMPRGKHIATGHRNAPNETVKILSAKQGKARKAMKFDIPKPSAGGESAQ